MTVKEKEVNKLYPKRNGFYYFGNNGNTVKYPSITKILGELDKSQFLVPWAAKKTASIALEQPWLTEDEAYSIHFKSHVCDAGTRGKGVHNIAGKLIVDKNEPYLDKYDPWVIGFKRFLNEFNPQPESIEKVVRSDKYCIAGTCDFIVRVGKERWILDIKTSANVYAEMGLQIEFYRQALSEMGIEVDRTRILHLPGNEKYSLLDLPGSMKVVKGLRDVYLWRLEQKGVSIEKITSKN